MAKHEKDFELEEFKAKYDKILDEGIETAKAVGQVASEKLDVYLQKAKKHIGKYAKKASEKIAEGKEKVEEKKAVIHEEREKEKLIKKLEDANALMELSRKAAACAQLKYMEVAEAQNKQENKSEEDIDGEDIFDEEDDDNEE